MKTHKVIRNNQIVYVGTETQCLNYDKFENGNKSIIPLTKEESEEYNKPKSEEELREGLNLIKSKLEERINQLSRYINEYKKENEFEAAMKCDIKQKSLQMVLNDINELLN